MKTARIEGPTWNSWIAGLDGDLKDPVFREGFNDGQAARCESAPNMGRGHRYAMGWLSGRILTDAASNKRN